MTQVAKDPSRLPAPRMTYEEFLDWADEDTHAEWVGGEVRFMTVSAEHNNIGAFLLALVLFFVDQHQLGRLFYEPFQMKTGPDLPGRSPDLFFVASANLGRVKKKNLDGPADLVVEIISPDSAERDRGPKYEEYEQGGVGEYWLLDPLSQRADFYQREGDGRFHARALDPDGFYHSRALTGFRLKPSWLWKKPLPSLPAVMREIGLI